jgi:hypothetical protein
MKYLKTYNENLNQGDPYANEDMFDNIGRDENGILIGNCKVCPMNYNKNGNGVDIEEHKKTHSNLKFVKSTGRFFSNISTGIGDSR